MFKTPFEIAQFVIGILGAVTTITCFVPQGIKTFLSKDTSGLSKWFFISAIVSGLIWITIGTLSIIGTYIANDWDPNINQLAVGISSGLPSILTNVICLFVNSMVLAIKLTNMKMANRLGITENEWCNEIKKNKAAKL